MSLSYDSVMSKSMLMRSSNDIHTPSRPVQRNFAGRIGGNQAFISDDEDRTAQPADATPLLSIRKVLAIQDVFSHDLWRLAVLEGFGSFLLVFVLGAFASGLGATDVSLFARVIVASVANWITLSLFTYCLAPTSGAHLTPIITLTTLFIGLTSLPRAVLYMTAQVVGAIVAGYWLRLATGHSYFPTGVIPGCTVINDAISPGQVFVLEFTFSFMMVFLACGLGLDPRQRSAIGPSYAPALVGLTLGIATLTSGFASTGWTGMSFNPARCLGLMTPLGNLHYHYIHWLAPLAATLLNGAVYHIVPVWSKKE